MGQFSDFRASSEETEPQFRNLCNTQSKIGFTKKFHLSQKSKSTIKESKSMLESTRANVAKRRWRDTNWTNWVWHMAKSKRMMCR